MWRQQVQQRLDAAEEQRHQTLDAAFIPKGQIMDNTCVTQNSSFYSWKKRKEENWLKNNYIWTSKASAHHRNCHSLGIKDDNGRRGSEALSKVLSASLKNRPLVLTLQSIKVLEAVQKFLKPLLDFTDEECDTDRCQATAAGSSTDPGQPPPRVHRTLSSRTGHRSPTHFGRCSSSCLSLRTPPHLCCWGDPFSFGSCSVAEPSGDVQQRLLVKQESPEESLGADQSDPEPLPIKQEQEELWSSQLGVKEEAHASRFPVIAVVIKSEDDEEKLLFPQLPHHQTDIDLPGSSSAEQMKAEPEDEHYGDAESGQTPELQSAEDASNFSETEVSEDDVGHCLEYVPETDDLDNQMNRVSGIGLESGGNAISRTLCCSGCGKQFTVCSLQSHMVGQPTVRCPSCLLIFSEKETADSQEDVQAGLKCFNCADCGKSFNRKNHLKVHMKIHLVEKTFVCDVCRQTFSQRTHLNRHVKIHTGEKPFGCEVCGQTFSRKSHLNRHIKIHTGEKPFGCDECGQRFHEKAYLDRHIKIHSGEKPFACEVCGQRFSRKAHLDRHMGSHADEKPFGCDLCRQRFTHKSALNRHMIIHTGDKPFSCDVCGQRFNQKSVLMTHVRIHTGDKPYACDFCGLRFNQKSNLNSHIKIHTGYRPFSCDVCGQKFNRKGNLNMHMRIHTAGKNA